MNPHYLLIFSLPAAHFLLYRLPFWEAKRDAAAILADGSANTLLGTWHRSKWWRRVGIVATICVLATAPLLVLGWLPWLVAAVGLGLAAGAWFFAKFNVALNVARNTAYVDKYYVSYSAASGGKWPDSFLWRKAWKQVYPTESVQYMPSAIVAAVAGQMLRKLLNLVLAGGALVYLAAGVAVWLSR